MHSGTIPHNFRPYGLTLENAAKVLPLLCDSSVPYVSHRVCCEQAYQQCLQSVTRLVAVQFVVVILLNSVTASSAYLDALKIRRKYFQHLTTRKLSPSLMASSNSAYNSPNVSNSRA